MDGYERAVKKYVFDRTNVRGGAFGMDGAPGPAGPAGANGAPGPAGPQGPAGTSVSGLILYIDEGPILNGAFKEITGSPWPTNVTWYTDATKTKKVVEKQITRSAEQAPTQIVWIFYQPDGVTPALGQTASDAITNTGVPAVFESTRTRTVT